MDILERMAKVTRAIAEERAGRVLTVNITGPELSSEFAARVHIQPDQFAVIAERHRLIPVIDWEAPPFNGRVSAMVPVNGIEWIAYIDAPEPAAA